MSHEFLIAKRINDSASPRAGRWHVQPCSFSRATVATKLASVVRRARCSFTGSTRAASPPRQAFRQPSPLQPRPANPLRHNYKFTKSLQNMQDSVEYLALPSGIGDPAA